MDEDDNSSSKGYATKPEAFVLPTAPRAARGPDMSDDRIPKDPPFTAYIANLSYDVDTEVVSASDHITDVMYHKISQVTTFLRKVHQSGLAIFFGLCQTIYYFENCGIFSGHEFFLKTKNKRCSPSERRRCRNRPTKGIWIC